MADTNDTTTANEFCPTCGQADNCGDCNHTPPPVGARIRLRCWAPSTYVDDNRTVPPGTLGTVRGSYQGRSNRDLDQVWVTWDNGSVLNLVAGGPTPDRYEYAEPGA